MKLYLELGMKLNKIHHAMQVELKAWLVPYIDFNTEKKKQAKNSFEKDFYQAE